MLTFNCSQAASDFFSRVHRGKKITSVQKSTAMHVGDDSLSADPHQWLVHAATVQRKHVLLAIHLKTRYCMLFFDMKKADAEGFVQAFINRWTDGVMDMALKCGALDLVDPDSTQQLLKDLTQSFCMVQRGDRGGQTHINEVLRNFKWDAQDFDFVNQPWSPRRYDAGTNNSPRSTKGRSGYTYPNEEMLIHWLMTTCGVSALAAEEVRDSYRKASRANVG